VAFMLIFLEGTGICQGELSKFAVLMPRCGGLLGEFWNRIIYEHPEVEHVCDDFGVVLTCNGESDFMICPICGKGWIVPCRIKGKAKGQTTS
jgi:hypothetical protein